MKERIIRKVERKELPVKKGGELLGMSRQGFLKLRKNYRQYGEKALLGLKRGLKRWHRPWQEVVTSYPGERVQIDTCFPWGRYGPCVMEAVESLGMRFEPYPSV